MAISNTSKALFAGILGLAAGVTIGLLLAPESGSKTRKKMKKRLRKVSANFKDQFKEEISRVKTAFNQGDGEYGPPGKKQRNKKTS